MGECVKRVSKGEGTWKGCIGSYLRHTHCKSLAQNREVKQCAKAVSQSTQFIALPNHGLLCPCSTRRRKFKHTGPSRTAAGRVARGVGKVKVGLTIADR
jgi:hypothetical protein